MTSKEDVSNLVASIRECAIGLEALGLPGHAEDLYNAANVAESSNRPSVPPVLASNLEARATASKHFQEARRLLKNIR